MIFRLIQDIGSEPKIISVISVQVGISLDDVDIRRFEVGKFGVEVLIDFPNKIFDVKVEAADRSAIVSWSTRDQGVDDVVSVSQIGQDGSVLATVGDFEPPFSDRAPEALQALRDLEAAGIDILEADPQVIRDFLAIPRPPFGADPFPALLGEAKIIVRQLRERLHVVPIHGLLAGATYRATIQSTGLSGRVSPQATTPFRTRQGADLRKLAAHGLDIQPGRTSITVKFSTNRLVKTSYTISTTDETVVLSGEVNPDGADKTTFTVVGLEPGVDYVVDITAELSGEIPDDLPAAYTVISLRKDVRTRLARKALNIAGIPFKVVGPESAVVKFRTPLPVAPIVFYGILPTDELVAGKVTQASAEEDTRFAWTTDGVSGTDHEMNLTALDPQTPYRYKIEFELTDNEGTRSFSTDSNGNEQWSRDLQFTTPRADDLFEPKLVKGPRVFPTDVAAVIQFGNDVPTTASAFVGTESTFNTADEFEFSDGIFSHRHGIVLTGLDQGVDYQFRLEFTAANGVSGSFTAPSTGAGKATAALQPPGGGGSFTTTNIPDTQFPVILTGPTVASKTHDTAIIEWTTDEPANSDIEFGTENLDEQETSGVSETSHKVTLSNLTSGTTYQYVVASTDASGNGATRSAQTVFTTDPEIDLTAPSIVGAPSISYKNDNSATVQWSTNEETTGEVQFGTDSSLGFIRTLPETETHHGITLTNLEASTTYFYAVSSTDLSNNGPTESSILSFTTDGTPDLTSPTISNIQVDTDQSSAILTWDTNELADSFVDFGTISGLLTSTVGDVEDVTDHEITLTNLATATTYFYTVGSIDRANNSPTESSQSSFTTLATADVTPPGAPTNLSGIPGSKQAVLSWDSSDELDLAGYRIERRVADTGSFVAIASGLEDPAYTDLGVTNLTTYQYRVIAVDRSENDSDASTTVSVTPTSTAAPSRPTGLAHWGALQPTFRFSNAVPFVADATLTY
ncbi:MAG: fibronectin type III domain-containing protein, partial [Chloroflexi bacterium]|nr:fibronectin type III domain-containing protein [Chloroflexota bacterium]